MQCPFYAFQRWANKIKIKRSVKKVRCCKNTSLVCGHWSVKTNNNNNDNLSETLFGQMTWWVNFLKSTGKLNLICVVIFLQIFEIPLCCFTSGKCCQLLTMNVSETVFQNLFRTKMEIMELWWASDLLLKEQLLMYIGFRFYTGKWWSIDPGLATWKLVWYSTPCDQNIKLCSQHLLTASLSTQRYELNLLAPSS